MQYRNYISRSDNPDRYDCASGHPNHPRCLFKEETIEINVPDFERGSGRIRIIKNPEDVWDYLAYARRLAPACDEIEHLLEVSGINICPAPLITPESIELARMCEFADRGLFPSPGGYFEQPFYFIEAVEIINAEENKLMLKANKDGRR